MIKGMDASDLRGLLLATYLEGFLLEHDVTWKSASRYPLSGASRSQMRERLEEDFEEWIKSTCLIGDTEREAILAAPTTVPADD